MSIHAQRNGSPSPIHNDSQRPTAKRSPSILVTDARSDKVKGARAPFAGQNYKKQQQQLEQQRQQQQVGGGSRGNYSFQQLQHLNALQQRFKNKFTDISVDKLLSNSSDIPSGQLRQQQEQRRNIRSIPKLSLSLPSRTSKTSQKLVLIPEEQRQGSPPEAIPTNRGGVDAEGEASREFSRMTAYFICEEFNLSEVAKFLRKNHEVKPRLYDEALYVPYALPLLPGNEGIRVKSNNTAKLLAKNKYMENMINKNEQTTHLYEYYSGKHDDDGTGHSTKSTATSNSIHSQTDVSKHHAEMFVFDFEIHEKNILADLAFTIASTNLQRYDYVAISRPLDQLTMSYAIAQLTKLELFESRMVNVLHLISKLPKKLALTGSLGLKQHQLMKKSGKLFKLRVDVNLSGSILDTPDFFWSSEPALHPLYTAVREYLEIDQRVQVLNNRCKVFLEFVDIINDSLNEKNTIG
ncbi:Sporulation protein RMD8 [Candida viswanathii]|uniref:Sporulation protein RMD8 n=1 Tax=Candida viswanathii TaxID=5486 RepID=A0A367YIG6_9ASCO|nr:Sporulation protein RMD8 [Candida viswanathii]